MAGRRKQGGSRLPFAVLALLALCAAGALVLLLRGPEQEPPRAVVRPDLSVPVLPARATTAPPAPGPSASASRDTRSPGPTGAAQPPPAVPGTLRPGDSGPEVRTLQGRLYAQGFTYVSVTGVYDEQTRRGVTQLQQNRSIKGDPLGIYGPSTRAAFESGG
ncbi:peptidoglycan-binding protein [Streptomyces sp. NPDC059443]|uniref:peptidoglycan-binding domain-containing protein n=1 Tax=unclassified Streptomyces TaxID=2593676 RepID=UPI0036828550